MYSREIDGQVLTLSASGWTYDSTFVLYDRETETMWYHLEGENAQTGVNGVFADRKLPELPSTLTRWNQWKQAFPNTGIMFYPRGRF